MRKNKVPAMKAKRQTAAKLRKAAKRKLKGPNGGTYESDLRKKLHLCSVHRGRGGTAGKRKETNEVA